MVNAVFFTCLLYMILPVRSCVTACLIAAQNILNKPSFSKINAFGLRSKGFIDKVILTFI